MRRHGLLRDHRSKSMQFDLKICIIQVPLQRDVRALPRVNSWSMVRRACDRHRRHLPMVVVLRHS